MEREWFCDSLTPARNRLEQTHPTICFKCHSLSLGISSWNNYLWSDALPAPDQLCFDLPLIVPRIWRRPSSPPYQKCSVTAPWGKCSLIAAPRPHTRLGWDQMSPGALTTILSVASSNMPDPRTPDGREE